MVVAIKYTKLHKILAVLLYETYKCSKRFDCLNISSAKRNVCLCIGENSASFSLSSVTQMALRMRKPFAIDKSM